VQSWREVLAELEGAVDEIASKGSEVPTPSSYMCNIERLKVN
jgi:hypothetical protein